MATPLIWLAIYLSAGSLVLWACYRTSACRLGSRVDRNNRIAALFGGGPDKPLPVAPERASSPR